MEQIVLTQEELQILKDFKSRQEQLTKSLGENELMKINIENQKIEILQSFDKLREEEIALGKQLNEKYGDGRIDLNTGVFSKL